MDANVGRRGNDENDDDDDSAWSAIVVSRTFLSTPVAHAGRVYVVGTARRQRKWPSRYPPLLLLLLLSLSLANRARV